MSFLLLLLYLVCTIIRPQDWVPGFYGLSLVNGLALGTIFFLLVERLGTKKIQFVNAPQNQLMVAFYVCILMSHIVHTYFGGLISATLAFVPNFIIYFLLLNGINTERKFKISIWFIVLLTFLLVPQGIYQVQHGYGWAGQNITAHEGSVRINWIGIFNDPNDLALLFVISVGIVLAFAFGRRDMFLKVVSLILLGFFLYGIFLTNSRSGLLALMATVYFFFVRRTKRFFWGGLFGGLMALIVLIFGPSRAGMINVTESSAFGRVELWYGGIQLLKSSPLFGVGYDMFMEELPQTAHSSFILAAAELGFLGLMAWVGLLYSSFKGLSIIQENDERLYNYALGLQSSLVGFCAAAFFLSRTYIILPFMLVALSGSLMYVAHSRNKNLNFAFTRKDLKTTFLLSVGVLLLSYGVIKFAL